MESVTATAEDTQNEQENTMKSRAKSFAKNALMVVTHPRVISGLQIALLSVALYKAVKQFKTNR